MPEEDIEQKEDKEETLFSDEALEDSLDLSADLDDLPL